MDNDDDDDNNSNNNNNNNNNKCFFKIKPKSEKEIKEVIFSRLSPPKSN